MSDVQDEDNLSLRNQLFGQEELHNWSVAERGSDPETEQAVCSLFARNVAGYTGAKSQFGGMFVTVSERCHPCFEEALGTERAKAILRKVVVDTLEPYKGSVAVCRRWPEIIRDAGGGLVVHMRLHLMTQADLDMFAPQES
jgi:hypothetical protein